MTHHTTPPLAQQLRSLAASAPTLHRPALAAAADAVEELSKLRAERDAARDMLPNPNHPEWAQAGDGTLHGAIDHWAERATKAEAERDEARDALRDLIGILEIAAVMPDAINKHMSIRIDDPGLQRARAALKGDAK